MKTKSRLVSVVLVCGAILTAGVAAAQLPPPPPARVAGPTITPDGAYTPPPCTTPIFNDVPCSNYFSAWINQLYVDQVSTGCPYPNFCPDQPVTRAQMSAFLERMMRGTANWPPNTMTVYQVVGSDGTPNQSASGQALLAAVAAIPTSGPGAPSSLNHWLIKVGPGTFNLSTSYVTLPGYVDLEGSGVETTQVIGYANTTGTVRTEGRNTLRNISIHNYGGTNSYGVFGSNGRLILRGVEIQGTGGSDFGLGIYLDNEMLDMENSTVMGSSSGWAFGIYSAGTQYHSMLITKSLVNGADNTIRNNAGYAVDLAYTGLYGGALYNTGTGVFHCIGNYSQTLAPVTCP